MSMRHRLFNLNFKGLKTLKEVGFITACLIMASKAYADTDSATITVHIRVVPSSNTVEAYQEKGIDEAFLRLPDPDALNMMQGEDNNTTVRTTVVEEEIYWDSVPISR